MHSMTYCREGHAVLNTDIIEYYRATIDSDSHLKRSVSFLNTFLVPAYLDSRSDA